MRRLEALLAACTLIAVVVALMLLWSIIAGPANAQDSVRVHIEEDPDGDGFYQIQYSYRDRAGVWGVPGRGNMRVMYEVAPGVMHTDWYAVFFNTIAETSPDSVYVDLELFGQFGMAFGTRATVFLDGTLSWSSPGGQWYYMPRPDAPEVGP